MKMVSSVFACILIGVIALYAQSAATFHQDVSWSPDGKHISFTGMHNYDQKTDGYKTDIYVIRADGSDQRQITADATNEYYTSFGKKLVAFSADVSGNKDSDIHTASPDGSGIRRLTRDAKDNTAPAFSPDGKSIAFMSTRDGGKFQIYVMRSDGSGARPLTNDQAVAHCNPQWSPDGKRIVYYTDIGDKKDQVWVMNADGSGKKLLTGGIGHNIFPGWSADGKRVIFSSSNRDGGEGSFVDGSYLYLINADGSGLAPLGTIKSFFARFSHDGKRLAYISGKFPSTSIYVANADGSGAVQITK